MHYEKVLAYIIEYRLLAATGLLLLSTAYWTILISNLYPEIAH